MLLHNGFDIDSFHQNYIHWSNITFYFIEVYISKSFIILVITKQKQAHFVVLFFC